MNPTARTTLLGLALLLGGAGLTANAWGHGSDPEPSLPDLSGQKPSAVEMHDLSPDIEGKETEVRIYKENTQEVREYRVKGTTYMIEVIPKNGAPPFFSVDETGGGTLAPRHPASEPNRISVPQWVIFRW